MDEVVKRVSSVSSEYICLMYCKPDIPKNMEGEKHDQDDADDIYCMERSMSPRFVLRSSTGAASVPG